MSPDLEEELLELVDRALAGHNPEDDILKRAPDLTVDDAYRLQIAHKRRLAERGDAHVGYRISTTSRNGVAEAVKLGIVSPDALDQPIRPMFTSLSASNIGGPDRRVQRQAGRYLYAEAEVAFVMEKRLAGPGVTAETARAAVRAVHAGFDMAQLVQANTFSLQHRLASSCSPADTTIILGGQASFPTFDLRTEGILVSIDGRERASATAWETLGGPYNALAWLANKLGELGAAIEPGHVVITGVCAYPQRIESANVIATAEFTRLGTVTAVIDGQASETRA